MRTLLILLTVWGLFPAPTQAQTLQFDLLADTQLLGTLEHTTAPRQRLLFQHKVWKHILFLVIPRADRHGIAGVDPGPGLCVEPGFQLPLWPDAVVITDLDNDGNQELIITGGQTIMRMTSFVLDTCGERRVWPVGR